MKIWSTVKVHGLQPPESSFCCICSYIKHTSNVWNSCVRTYSLKHSPQTGSPLEDCWATGEGQHNQHRTDSAAELFLRVSSGPQVYGWERKQGKRLFVLPIKKPEEAKISNHLGNSLKFRTAKTRRRLFLTWRPRWRLMGSESCWGWALNQRAEQPDTLGDREQNKPGQ